MAITKLQPFNLDTTGNYTFANIATDNANLGNAATANFFIGSGNNLSNIQGANVTGAVSSASTSGTVTTNAQPNITSVGTLTGITSTGTVNLTGASNVALGPVANVHITGGTNGQYLQTDGSGTLSWSTVSTGAASNISNGNSNVNIPAANGNINLTAVGNTTMVITGTGANISGTINVTGNATLGNIITSGSGGNITNVNVVSANTFLGSFANGNSNINIPTANGNINLTAVGNTVMVITGTGANISGTANVSGTLTAGNANLGNLVTANYFTGTLTTASQPNITSVGTLTNISVSGNGVFGGNLTVNGTLTYINSTTLSISDPIINLQTGPNGAAPVANTGKDVGTALNYYDTSAKIAWMGWDISNAEISFGSNVSIASEVVTVTSLANIRSGNADLGNNATANYFTGNGVYLTGITLAGLSNGNSNINIPASNGNINFTAVGNANVVVITGTGANISGTANISGNLSAGNIIAGSGSGGNITNANVISANTFTASGNITAGAGSGGNITGANLVSANYFTGTLTTNAQPNITSVGSLTGLTVSNATGIVDFTTTANVTLGAVANLHISGGTSAYVLSTDGAGNLSWVAQSGGGGGASISNGNSNVNIPAANGNVNISAVGNANILVVTGTGANISGTANISGNLSAGNIIAGSGSGGNITNANVISANTFTASGNITAGAGSGGNITGANLVSANYFTGTLTTAAQPNITSVGTLSSLTVTANITGGNLLGPHANGNSNVSIPAGNGNINFTAVGNTIMVITGTGVNVAGTLNTGSGVITGNGSGLSSLAGANVSGQVANALISGTVYTNAQPNITSVGSLTGLTVSNATGVVDFTTTANVTLGAVANLHISGGTNGYVLSTDGSSTLSWVAQSGGGGSPGGTDTQVQFNDSSAFGGNAGLTFNKTTTTLTANNFVATSTANLGSNANVIITGGTNGYVLSTNGAGGLSWIASGGGGGGGASISNGTSNVDIVTSGGNITMGVGGTANVVVVSTAGISAAIQPRIATIADGTTVTMNADTTDMAIQTNTQTAGTLTIAAPTGTPYQGQKLMFRLQSTNVQTFSWNAVFDGSTDLNLPTTSSGTSKYDYMGFIYNATSSKWDMLSKNFGF